MRKFFIFFLLFSIVHKGFAQLDSIFDQSTWRKFIVHLPVGYNSSNQYPLVINLHGLNSSAAQQESYSQFNSVSDNKNFITVYPEGISNSWDVNGTTDVMFINNLIDTLRNRYSCNTCLFIMGMSEGGFMTYKLACTLPKPIKAIAIGSGNMAITLQNNCGTADEIPIMHFHGTADPLVNYNGVGLIAPVDTTVKWWVTHNGCNTTPVYTSIPDTSSGDSCYAEKYYYSNGINGSEVTFYKIINGGHTWSGTIPVPPLGRTCMDFNQSVEIGNFFESFCSLTTNIEKINDPYNIKIYPNPTKDFIVIMSDKPLHQLAIFNHEGKIVEKISTINNTFEINTLDWESGTYFIQSLDNEGNTITQKFLITK